MDRLQTKQFLLLNLTILAYISILKVLHQHARHPTYKNIIKYQNKHTHIHLITILDSLASNVHKSQKYH